MKTRVERPLLPNRIFTSLAAAFLFSLVAGTSLAADPPDVPAAADNITVPVPQAADNTTGPVSPIDNNWVDRTHSRVERDLFETVVWFDKFFGDERMKVAESPEWFMRWKNDLRWDEEEQFSFRSTIRASLRLPRLKKRFKLAFSGETRSDPNAITAEDPGNPGLPQDSRIRTGSTELIYDIIQKPRTTLDIGAGVRVKIPPDAFVRTRFQNVRPLAYKILGRYTGTAFWDARDGFGETNQIDLERWVAVSPLVRWSDATDPTLLRWSNTIEITEKSNGWTWGTELSLLQKLSPKSAVTFAGGVSGSTRPAWIAQNYQVLVRYRRNVFRKWLYIEGEPGVHWPRKEDGSRNTVWSGTLRVEILFTGTGPKPPESGAEKNPLTPNLGQPGEH